MAAILPHLEARSYEDERDPPGRILGLGVLKEPPSLNSAHAGLLRTAWIRQSLEEELVKRQVHFRVEADPKTRLLYFYLKTASGASMTLPSNIVPWYQGAIEAMERFSLFGENGKMLCATWDLPAGAPAIGGTCPGATPGQSIVLAKERAGQMQNGKLRAGVPTDQLKADGTPKTAEVTLNLQAATCENCYALEGNYPSPHVQLGEIIRYWWTRQLTLTPAGRAEFVSTMVRAIQALLIPISRHGNIKPIRVHSSGDFFSPAYAIAWIEVANQLWRLDPAIRLWAPTRTWAAAGWVGLWPRMLQTLVSVQETGDPARSNFVIRPSSYHMRDFAPGPLGAESAQGSTVLFNAENYGMREEFELAIESERARQYQLNREALMAQGKTSPPRDPRYDWDCQTYAVRLSGGGDLAPSCEDARAPDGQRGCRACWVRPDLKINYTAH